MINFNYTTDFSLENETKYIHWLESIIEAEGFICGEINYIFCDDNKILEVNNIYLDHDYFTDIISFDYCNDNIISGDIFISIDMVISNSKLLNSDFNLELLRVMVHGVLHYIGYNDKTDEEKSTMRSKENDMILLFN